MAGPHTLSKAECISAHSVSLAHLPFDWLGCLDLSIKLETVQPFGYDYPKMSQDERAKLLERKARLDARLKQLALQESKQQRKDDTRRKVIAGALALEHAETDPEFAGKLTKLLNRYVTRPQDRALFAFLDDRQPETSPTPSESFSIAAAPPSPASSNQPPHPPAPPAP